MSQQSVIITNGITDVEAKNVQVDGTEQGLVTRPIISGANPDGYAPTVNPLLVAGTDPSGNVQTLSVGTDGYLNVNATVTVSSDDDAATPGGPAPSKVAYVGGKDPAGNIEPLATTVDGYLKVTIVSDTADTDAGVPGSATPSNASYVAGKDPSGNLKPLELTADGYLKVILEPVGAAVDVNVTNTVNVDLANVSAVDGSTAPVKTVQVGGKDGAGNIQTLSTTTDGYLNVNLITSTDDDAGTPGSAAPSKASYVAGRDSSGNLKPLELTTDGYLKVTVVSDTGDSDAGSTGSAVPSKASFVGAKDDSGNLQALEVDGYGNLRVTQGATGSYQFINTASQTLTLKSGPGVFRRVIIGNAGQTAALITFYDNTAGSGTVIAKVNPSNVLGTLEFDIAFTTGLTYVTNAKTPGDVTVTFE